MKSNHQPTARAYRRLLWSTLFVWTGLTLGCSADDNQGDASDDTDTGGIHTDGAQWYGDIDAIVDQNCGGCHIEGGSGPFDLSTPLAWQSLGAAAMYAIDTGSMPPWLPDPDCNTFENHRIMPAADIERLRAWLDADQPLGDPENATPISEPLVFEADLRLTIPAPYTPTLADGDDYRCFVLDHTVEETTFLTSSFVEPGNGLVHHVLAYALTDADAEAAIAADAEDPDAGYQCFGGPVPETQDQGGSLAERFAARANRPQQIGAWVPGQSPVNASERISMQLDAGAVFVIQVHYSAVAGEPLADDATTLLLATTSQAPEFLRTTRPVAVRNLDIPAGDPGAVNQATLPFFGDSGTVIRALSGHMHLLGNHLHADIVRASGDRECAITIPEWDFAWQETYGLAEEDWIVLASGDAIELTCVYDNSAENQPVVDGVQVEPRDVAWGDGTLDEMCLLYLDTVTPYVAEAEGAICPVSCADTCDGSDAQCVMQCAGADLECVGCVLDATIECGGASCTALLGSEVQCISTCGTSAVMLGTDFDACLAETCGGAYTEFLTCVDDVFGTPACTRALAGCVQ